MLDSYVSSPCIIVIEEDVVVSPDFLDFIGQLLDGFLSDSTANIIQLFNKNGIIFKIFYNETIFEVEALNTLGKIDIKSYTIWLTFWYSVLGILSHFFRKWFLTINLVDHEVIMVAVVPNKSMGFLLYLRSLLQSLRFKLATLLLL